MNLKQSAGITYFSFSNMEAWPDLTQAAFARAGGVSAGPFASLNVSYAVEDDPDNVAENRRRVARSLGWEPKSFVTAGQVHGRRAVHVVREMSGGPDLAGADALVTNEPGVLLLLKFADCVPVVLWDPVKRVVGIAHAGWRGTVLGTPAAAVELMTSSFGTDPRELVAGIGPSIGPCCYQVGPEVEKAASQVFAGAGVVRREREDDIRFDLWSANAETLMRSGIPEEKIEIAGLCTRCNGDTFFSHRGSGGRTGRFGVVAGVRE